MLSEIVIIKPEVAEYFCICRIVICLCHFGLRKQTTCMYSRKIDELWLYVIDKLSEVVSLFLYSL